MPEVLKACLSLLASPEILYNVVTGDVVLAEEYCKDLMRRYPIKERRDQGLHNRDRAVEGPRVTPTLQLMRLRNVPVALGGSLVIIESQVDAQGNLLKSLRELQIGRCIKNRIAAEDQQDIDIAGVHVLDQRAQ